MTLLDLMPIPPHLRALHARLKPECRQRMSNEAKRWTSTEHGKACLARMTALSLSPEARLKQSQTRLRNADSERRRQASMVGNPTFRRCRFCKLFDDPANMSSMLDRSTRRYYHKPCAAENARKWRSKNA